MVTKHTEASMIDLLHERYGTRSQGNGNRYVAMSHVRSDAGFDAERTADFMALDLWPSKGLTLHGHEVKISRSDWLNELKDPEKSAAFMKHVDYWWLVIADKDMVKAGELPKGWGMMTIGTDGKLRVLKQAPRLTTPEYVTGKWGQAKPVHSPVHRGLAASMLRAAAKTSKASATKEVLADHDAWKATHETVSETHTVRVRRYDNYRLVDDATVLVTSDLAEAEQYAAQYAGQHVARIETKVLYQYGVEDTKYV